jgi:vacuolar-type H+-ATPase subunit H
MQNEDTKQPDPQEPEKDELDQAEAEAGKRLEQFETEADKLRKKGHEGDPE